MKISKLKTLSVDLCVCTNQEAKHERLQVLNFRLSALKLYPGVLKQKRVQQRFQTSPFQVFGFVLGLDGRRKRSKRSAFENGNPCSLTDVQGWAPKPGANMEQVPRRPVSSGQKF